MTAGVLGDALRLLKGPDGATPRAIVKLAGQALSGSQSRLGWLIADRLVRRELHNGATAHILRASAGVQLGAVAAAAADLDRARTLNPGNVLLVETELNAADPAHRLKAARRWLASPDVARQGKALMRLRSDGYKTVVTGAVENGAVQARVWWSGEKAIVLTWSDGESVAPFPPALIITTGRADFPWAANLSLSWPQGCEALSIVADREPVFRDPVTLHRPDTDEMPAPIAATAPLQTARRLLIVIPVHDDKDATQACIASVLETPQDPLPWRLLIIDDNSPDPTLSAALAVQAATGAFAYERNSLNRGFARSVNRALARREVDEDVLLLNADTVVPSGAIARLAEHIRRDPTIGTVTPLSNNGEDTSFPQRFADNAMPARDELEALNDLANQANHGKALEMPNGVGFCLYIGRQVFTAIGAFSTRYGRGYYEDVDFCLRAEAAGFRNVCAVDTVVGHLGSRSFKDDKASLVRANLLRIEERFPGYRARTARFFQEDPLLQPVQRLEMEWLRQRAGKLRLIVAPSEVPTWLMERLIAAEEQGGLIPILGRYTAEGEIAHILLRGHVGMPQNLDLALPDAGAGGMRALLAACRFGGITLVDPRHLPATITGPVHDCSVPLHIAAASNVGLALMSPAPDLASSAMAASLWSAAKRRPNVAPASRELPAPPNAGVDGGLALLPELGEPECWQLALACSDQAKPGQAFAYLGAPGEGRQPENLWSTGQMTRKEAATWLERTEVGALLFSSRRFGLADTRLGEWLEGGGAAAWFDPAVSQVRAEGRALRLPLTMPAEESGALITRWLADLVRGRV